MRFDVTIENAIYDWVKMIHPSTLVIWDKQDANRPTTDYILLNIITAGNMEAKSKLSNNPITSGGITLQSFETMTVSINVFAQEGYLETMASLQRSTDFDEVKQYLRSQGLNIRSYGNIIDLTELVDTGYEFRCQCDFRFAYSKLTEIVVNPVSRIAGTVNDITFDVEVTE